MLDARPRSQRRRRRVLGDAVLVLGELAGLEPREDVPGEQLALLLVRITRQDERADAHGDVAVELLDDLVGVADQRGAAAGAGAADAGPEVRLDEAFVVGLVAHLGLARDA